MNNQWYAFGEGFGITNFIHPTRIDDSFPTVTVTVTKIVASLNCFFMLCENGNLYVVGKGEKGEMGLGKTANIEKWTLCKQSVVDVQTGVHNSFVFCEDKPPLALLFLQ